MNKSKCYKFIIHVLSFSMCAFVHFLNNDVISTVFMKIIVINVIIIIKESLYITWSLYFKVFGNDAGIEKNMPNLK